LTEVRRRGPGKRPALMCTSIRLSREVMEYFARHHPEDKQAAMRAVLTAYVQAQPTKETLDESETLNLQPNP
jgi:hypothetical protein